MNTKPTPGKLYILKKDGFGASTASCDTWCCDIFNKNINCPMLLLKLFAGYDKKYNGELDYYGGTVDTVTTVIFLLKEQEIEFRFYKNTPNMTIFINSLSEL